MNKILVTYATNSGTTADVAVSIEEQLQLGGLDAKVFPLNQVESLEGYDAIVLGGPMIVGWHREAVDFLKKNRETLSKLPVALFVTCVSLTETGETDLDGVPLYVDEKLPKAPKNPDRLSFKEKHTTVSNYMRPVLKAVPQVEPVSLGIFGGRLEIYRLKWWQALFVMLVIQAQPGDRRNWEAIRAWGSDLANTLHKS
jgi:menaquinone-dependent protoporphyrinogen oxidase